MVEKDEWGGNFICSTAGAVGPNSIRNQPFAVLWVPSAKLIHVHSKGGGGVGEN